MIDTYLSKMIKMKQHKMSVCSEINLEGKYDVLQT